MDFDLCTAEVCQLTMLSAVEACEEIKVKDDRSERVRDIAQTVLWQDTVLE